MGRSHGLALAALLLVVLLGQDRPNLVFVSPKSPLRTVESVEGKDLQAPLVARTDQYPGRSKPSSVGFDLLSLCRPFRPERDYNRTPIIVFATTHLNQPGPSDLSRVAPVGAQAHALDPSPYFAGHARARLRLGARTS